ncbi:hypothetical protein KCU67_g3491, partial [Aureobasidium melanogenum]
MPSPYSTKRSELCRHDSWRVGCVSCKQDDIGEACAELEVEIAMTNEYLCALPLSISQAPTEEERQKLEKEEEKVKVRHGSLLDCLSGSRLHMDKVAAEKPNLTYTRRVKAKKSVSKAEITDSCDKEEFKYWRCMERDDKFFEVTLPSWKKQREDQRATMIEGLSKWNLSNAVAAGFDDGSPRYGDPRKYWPHSKPGEMEAEEALKHK